MSSEAFGMHANTSIKFFFSVTFMTRITPAPFLSHLVIMTSVHTKWTARELLNLGREVFLQALQQEHLIIPCTQAIIRQSEVTRDKTRVRCATRTKEIQRIARLWRLFNIEESLPSLSTRINSNALESLPCASLCFIV